MAAAVKARRYAIAGVCLLIVAAALRFYGISEHGLLYDEALAAVNSKGAFAEVIYNTREKNSSPILYPIALWAVQKVASTEFSARVMPAAASALTVAALLFVMPRLGVPRRAAFLAALLATLSVAAIEHAQNSREYSVDALIAALMIAGLLQYLRGGGKALLCAALFVGPLLQYGLALFGVAALGVAIVAVTPPPVHMFAEKDWRITDGFWNGSNRALTCSCRLALSGRRAPRVGRLRCATIGRRAAGIATTAT